MDDFSNRMEAQRDFLKVINSSGWSGEPLSSLSDGAIQRWIMLNRLDTADPLVACVKSAGEALHFLANESQQQISDEYRARSHDFALLLREAKAATVAKSAAGLE